MVLGRHDSNGEPEVRKRHQEEEKGLYCKGEAMREGWSVRLDSELMGCSWWRSGGEPREKGERAMGLREGGRSMVGESNWWWRCG